MEKQVDTLASQIGKSGTTPNYKVNQFIKNVSAQKTQPIEPQPVPTKQKPPKTPTTTPTVEPETEPTPEEPTTTTLPQPKQKKKPSNNPNGEEPLYESVFKRIKTLMNKIN